MKQKPKAKPQVSKGKNTKPKAGLSFSEKKRLKELQRTLAGNHKEQVMSAVSELEKEINAL